MSKQITILKVDKEKSPKGYVITSVAYESEGKTKGQKIYPFKEQADVAAAFADAKQGDVYEVNFQKNDRDFWEFAPTPRKLDAGQKAEPMQSSSKQQWVPDAERQVLIVRQSCTSSAVEFLKSNPKAKPSDVVDVAKVFEAYVFAKPDNPVLGVTPARKDIE